MNDGFLVTRLKQITEMFQREITYRKQIDENWNSQQKWVIDRASQCCILLFLSFHSLKLPIHQLALAFSIFFFFFKLSTTPALLKNYYNDVDYCVVCCRWLVFILSSPSFLNTSPSSKKSVIKWLTYNYYSSIVVYNNIYTHILW